METTDQHQGGAQDAPGAIPPEVEAELRRRAREAQPEDALPPEVEAELRQRAQAGTGSPAGEEGVPSSPGETAASEPHPWQERLKVLGPLGALLLFLLGKGKFLALLLKFGLPLLKTGGTMLLSMVVYAQTFGWWFAAGFVLSILAHEMGHVYVAWRMGVPVSAPIFIPGFGALILQKRAAKSTWDEALIGIGGPVAGTLAGLVCLGIYLATGSPLMLGLAYTGFLINLFNLAPIFPLDGGWITGAVSPRIWLLGIVGMLALVFTGTIRNPLFILLVLLSLPRLWKGLTTGDVTPEGGVPTTPQQRMVMGLSYVALCGLLAWLVGQTHVAP